jgi:hypothetical protein
MEFKDVFNHHLSKYVSEGAGVASRLNFLTLLFLDIRRNGLDVDECRQIVQTSLKLSFVSEILNNTYEMCLIRDVDKAVSLTIGEDVPLEGESSPPIKDAQVEEFPDDVPNIDREAFKNRKAVIDH